MYSQFDISGKFALITGATKGIGYAIAQDLYAAGCNIILVGRNLSSLNKVADKLSGSGKNDVYYINADVSIAIDRKNILEKLKDITNQLDILVNNVGTNIRKKIHEYSEKEIQYLFQTNLFSALDLSMKLYPLLKNSDSASIINIASVAGLGHLKTGAIYGITKAALIQLTKNLAVEWADENIRVNAIAPWYIDTPLARQVLKNKNYLDEVLNRTPMKRIGKANEVSGLVIFLSSPASGYITGQCIAVDGGFSINFFS